jgi:hypothetical protein
MHYNTGGSGGWSKRIPEPQEEEAQCGQHSRVTGNGVGLSVLLKLANTWSKGHGTD